MAILDERQQDRYNELLSMEASGTIDDEGRNELQRLRDRMQMSGE